MCLFIVYDGASVCMRVQVRACVYVSVFVHVHVYACGFMCMRACV